MLEAGSTCIELSAAGDVRAITHGESMLVNQYVPSERDAMVGGVFLRRHGLDASGARVVEGAPLVGGRAVGDFAASRSACRRPATRGSSTSRCRFGTASCAARASRPRPSPTMCAPPSTTSSATAPLGTELLSYGEGDWGDTLKLRGEAPPAACSAGRPSRSPSQPRCPRSAG